MSGRNLRTLAATLILAVLIAGPAAALPAERPLASAPLVGDLLDLLRSAWQAVTAAVSTVSTGEEGGSLDPNGGLAGGLDSAGDEGGSLDPNG